MIQANMSMKFQIDSEMNDQLNIEQQTTSDGQVLIYINQIEQDESVITPLKNLVGFENNRDELIKQSYEQTNEKGETSDQNKNESNELNDKESNQVNCQDKEAVEMSNQNSPNKNESHNHIISITPSDSLKAAESVCLANDDQINKATNIRNVVSSMSSENLAACNQPNDKSKTNNLQTKETSEKKKKRANQADPNSKKKKKAKKWSRNSVIDKNKLTMFDLISYNPPVNDKQSNGETVLIGDKDTDEKPLEEASDECDPVEQKSDTECDESDEEESIGPRVKINENGEIVLDEASLIVKRKKPKDLSIKTVYEDDKTLSTRTNYSSFKKPGKSNEKKLRWTDDETVKFYTALTIIGTDFTLMSELFFRDQRSRVDLKNKFKQEEKCHKVLIDNALKKSDLTSIQNLENFNFDLHSSDDSDPENTKDVNKLTTTAS